MASATQFVTVAKVAEVPEGGARRVYVQGRPIALFNVDGEIYAIDDTCSHAEASLSEGELDDDVVECPKHGARFCVRTGKNLSLPAVVPVKSHPVRIEGGAIRIRVMSDE